MNKNLLILGAEGHDRAAFKMYLIIKRMFDFILALVGLIILSPVFFQRNHGLYRSSSGTLESV